MSTTESCTPPTKAHRPMESKQARGNSKGSALIQRQRAQRDERQAEAVQLHRDGLTAKQIARQIGVGEQTAKRYLSTAAALWRQRMPAAVEKARRLMEARLLDLDELAAAEFERSKEPIVKEVTERTTDAEGVVTTKVRVERTGRVAVPAFLAERRKLEEQLCRLYGIDAAPQQPVDFTPQGPPVSIFALVQAAQTAEVRVVGDTLAIESGPVALPSPDELSSKEYRGI